MRTSVVDFAACFLSWLRPKHQLTKSVPRHKRTTTDNSASKCNSKDRYAAQLQHNFIQYHCFIMYQEQALGQTGAVWREVHVILFGLAVIEGCVSWHWHTSF